MKCISLWQPWASAIALGLKKVETRSWKTDYRGPIAIHAAKRPMDEEGRMVIDELERVYREMNLRHTRSGRGTNPALTELMTALRDPPYGAIVATAKMVGCNYTHTATGEAFETSLLPGKEDKYWLIGAVERWLGNYAAGRYAWFLEDIKKLEEPIPWRGTQGIFEADVPGLVTR